MTEHSLLLVEDNQFFQEIYTDVLTSSGYTVNLAKDGEEAYHKISQEFFPLIILDVLIPKMDGFTLVRKLHKEQLTKQYKTIIFLTNLDTPKQKQEALILGNDYAVKSNITPQDLVMLVKKYLP